MQKPITKYKYTLAILIIDRLLVQLLYFALWQ
jgi:hypothetical protein